MLNKEAVREMVKEFSDSRVGCVAGEKRIAVDEKDQAAAGGEGFYWTYESKLKEWDSRLYSAVGAAGELFAIRTSLFEKDARRYFTGRLYTLDADCSKRI